MQPEYRKEFRLVRESSVFQGLGLVGIIQFVQDGLFLLDLRYE